MHRLFRIVSAWVLALALLVAVVGCGSDDKPSSSAKPSGSLKVFAAASLTEAFNEEKATLKTVYPDLTIVYNFAGSGALVAQVQQGAPADVIATADTSSMKMLTDDDLVETPKIFAKNKLEILVEPGNPKAVKGLADLARTDLKVVLADETVPAGKYAAQSLKSAGVTVKPVSKEPDVKAAVAKVTNGEADATIVYVTDVKAAGSKGQGVEIPDAQNVVAEYPIAIVKATKNHKGAVAFEDAIVNGSGQKALEEHGFLPAS